MYVNYLYCFYFQVDLVKQGVVKVRQFEGMFSMADVRN